MLILWTTEIQGRSQISKGNAPYGIPLGDYRITVSLATVLKFKLYLLCTQNSGNYSYIASHGLVGDCLKDWQAIFWSRYHSIPDGPPDLFVLKAACPTIFSFICRLIQVSPRWAGQIDWSQFCWLWFRIFLL